MTTEETERQESLARLNRNVARIEELSQRLVAAMARRRPAAPGLQAPSQEVFVKAAAAYFAEMMRNPSKIIEQQVGYWGKTLRHAVEAQHRLARGNLEAPPDLVPADRRFANPLWDSHPYFNFVKQQYLITSAAITEAVGTRADMPERERRRIEYFTRQIIDMLAPTNFLPLNPEAMQKAVETEGESLVKGLENLVRDLETNEGELVVTLADRDAFRVGENLATTEGAVVWRNRLFELIQYAPRSATVHRTPLVLFPPWINKFYILDLKPANSLVRWIVDQGFTLFVVSWVNPDARHRDVGMDSYVEEGYLAAIREVRAITGEAQVNAIGYCIGGTTLALALALMARRGERPVRSATFFTTLTDFSDQGELAVFLDEDFLAAIDRECADEGYLRSFYMSRTFSYLRANDLIYQPAIRSYMMGETPPAFDLLFWNGDSTNLPGRMTVEYLRELCQDDRFARGTFTMLGHSLAIADVAVPVCAIACETDHIAAWRSSYAGVRQMGSADKTFILSESGHIAGIVNPPGKKKYGHYTNEAMPGSAEDWKAGATRHEGSWWPRWGEWLAARSGKRVPARAPGDAAHPVLAAAPGTYVVADPDRQGAPPAP
ncbi:MAG: class I poly(R)-hydroxyalkanoic acid synthase [Rhodobacteraceae bacterium]|nr:class I poly(R)-hydroxyalkanoic acid synthase [Paracoccaceae bacterium]